MQKRDLNVTDQGSGYSHMRNGSANNWWSGIRRLLGRWLNTTPPATSRPDALLAPSTDEHKQSGGHILLRKEGNVHYVDFQRATKTGL